ncbi:MAG: hypothetical protein ABIP97_03505, partial [Chthoniobacterales bacterium]
SFTMASDRNRNEYRKRFFTWLLGIIAFLGVGIGGFFLGKYQTAEPTAPVIYKSSPEVRNDFDEFYKAKSKGDMQAGLVLLKKIAAVDPDMPGIDFQLAETAFKLKDYDSARLYANQGIAKNNRPELCEMILGLTQWRQHTIAMTSADKMAAEQLESSYEMNPSNPYSLYFWGEIEREAGNFSHGSELIMKAADRVDPLDSVLVLHVKAKLAAIQAQRAAIGAGNVPPDLVKGGANGDQQLLQALVYLYQGKSQEAVLAAREAKTVFPPELFSILIYDSSFREFQLDPAFKEFFNKP